jgi:hypothetical protein
MASAVSSAPGKGGPRGRLGHETHRKPKIVSAEEPAAAVKRPDAATDSACHVAPSTVAVTKPCVPSDGEVVPSAQPANSAIRQAPSRAVVRDRRRAVERNRSDAAAGGIRLTRTKEAGMWLATPAERKARLATG